MAGVIFTLCAGWCLRSVSGDRPSPALDCVAWFGMLVGGIRMGLEMGR